jgi:poly(ADP-ribose) glycohydrolase
MKWFKNIFGYRNMGKPICHYDIDCNGYSIDHCEQYDHPRRLHRQSIHGTTYPNISIASASNMQSTFVQDDPVIYNGNRNASIGTESNIQSSFERDDHETRYPRASIDKLPFKNSAFEREEHGSYCIKTQLGPELSSFQKIPSCSPEMESLNLNQLNLTSLIRLDRDLQVSPPQPYPDLFFEEWNKNYVRLPCSKQAWNAIGMHDDNRWSLIHYSLFKNFLSSLDVEKAILSYNRQYSTLWNFGGLHTLFDKVFCATDQEKYLHHILPKMVHLTLQLPEICTQPIPLLKEQNNHTVVMSQKQASCLLANAFFCTFPFRNNDRNEFNKNEYSSYPQINFSNIFADGHTNVEKLKCILHYFERVTNEMPTGTISFQRQSLHILPIWSQSQSLFTRLHVAREGTIEESGAGMLQVDFANKSVGGGVLGRGCVQEEIRFLICPELIVSMLFTEAMADNECLIMTGCEQYSHYIGYADTFKWNGPYYDKTPQDSLGRRRIELVAIDAKPYCHQTHQQFSSDNIIRELNKAFCGFMRHNQDPNSLSAIATGNWGCGAFGGDKELKSLIQLMAAAETCRDVVYLTFNDERLMQELHLIHTLLIKEKITVGKLFTQLVRYNKFIGKNSKAASSRPVSLFQFLYKSLQK